MARLTIEKASAGTPFELQTRNGTTTDRWVNVIAGHIHDLPAARVVNTVIPGAVGQAPDGAPIDDSMDLRLGGYIAGVGTTAALRRASFRAQMAALRAQVVSAGSLVIVKAHPPVEGLTGVQVASITAQVERFVWQPILGWEHQDFVLELVCLSDPVGWSIA